MNIYSIHQIPNMPSLLPGQAVPICKLHHTPCDFFSVSHLCALPLSIKVPPFPCQTLKHFFFLSSSFCAAYSVDLLLLSIHLYTPLQYSCLEIPMDGGAWQVAVHGVAKSRTRLCNFTFTFHFHALQKEMATHSSVLVWRIPGMGEPGGLPSMGSHRVRHD